VPIAGRTGGPGVSTAAVEFARAVLACRAVLVGRRGDRRRFRHCSSHRSRVGRRLIRSLAILGRSVDSGPLDRLAILARCDEFLRGAGLSRLVEPSTPAPPCLGGGRLKAEFTAISPRAPGPKPRRTARTTHRVCCGQLRAANRCVTQRRVPLTRRSVEIGVARFSPRLASGSSAARTERQVTINRARANAALKRGRPPRPAHWSGTLPRSRATGRTRSVTCLRPGHTACRGTPPGHPPP
jgi:hypothetical protein